MKKAKPETKKQKAGRRQEVEPEDRFDEEPEEGRRTREEEPEEKEY